MPQRRRTAASDLPALIDIGANLTSPVFEADLEDVLGRADRAGVAAVVVTGTSVAASQAAARLADANSDAPRLYATAGVHPHDAAQAPDGFCEALAVLAQQAVVVAIGETGLDYHRNYSPQDVQRAVFRGQVELAVATGLPLFVHDRESGGDTCRILADYAPDRCVIHCFTGTEAELDGYLEAGYYIGITGWVCDERRGGDLARLVPSIPADRLMIETDAPYLLPRSMTPKPRSRRNEPAYLGWVARRVAECRGVAVDEVQRQTHANAARFFGLDA